MTSCKIQANAVHGAGHDKGVDQDRELDPGTLTSQYAWNCICTWPKPPITARTKATLIRKTTEKPPARISIASTLACHFLIRIPTHQHRCVFRRIISCDCKGALRLDIRTNRDCRILQTVQPLDRQPSPISQKLAPPLQVSQSAARLPWTSHPWTWDFSLDRRS